MFVALWWIPIGVSAQLERYDPDFGLWATQADGTMKKAKNFCDTIPLEVEDGQLFLRVVMGSRTFVLDPAREIMIRTEKSHGRRAYLSVDGNSVFDIENGDLLRVRRSEHHTLMADMGLRSFYETAYEKLR